MLENTTTSAITMPLMASTSFVLRRNLAISPWFSVLSTQYSFAGAKARNSIGLFGTAESRALTRLHAHRGFSVSSEAVPCPSERYHPLPSSVAVGGCAYRRSVFLQFVVQRLETDAQNLSSAGLVIVG